MSYSITDWRKAITNLLKKTSKRELSWDQSDLSGADAWTQVDRAFQTEMAGKIYVVSQGRRRYYLDEEEWCWSAVYNFSIFTSGVEPSLIITAPDDLSLVDDLFEAAELSYAFANDALGGLL